MKLRHVRTRDEPIWRTPTSARWSAGIAMSPDGERRLTVDDDTRLVERDAYTGAERWCWDEKLHHSKTLAFSGDGTEVLWCGGGVESSSGGYGSAAVMLYDVVTQQRRWRAPYGAPRFHVATFEPSGSATIELADADLDRITSLACADQLVAAGTNGGHTFIYGIVP